MDDLEAAGPDSPLDLIVGQVRTEQLIAAQRAVLAFCDAKRVIH
jgi:hypothetical protein